MAMPWHDRPGDPFQLLSRDVAYLKLEDVKPADVPQIFKKAEGTKGMVIDLRNYPQYLPWVIGPILATKPTPFVSFTSAEAANPGAFAFRAEATLPVNAQHYRGRVVVLVDEVTQSRAEFTAMALRAVGALVVGSTTAGADGDVAEIALPGGQSTIVSGLGVFYPDHRPTQRVGIVPDVVVTPTINGITQGRDEVLERAMQVIEGHWQKDEHR
jgi:C-terminal processing protease CtpA/Prc